MIKKIDFEEAKNLIDKTKNCNLVDVRAEEEYITGHAVDAILFPLDQINKQNAEDILPDLNAPVIVYCKSGRRSSEAAKKLDELGYQNIYDLGSLVGWPYGLDY